MRTDHSPLRLLLPSLAVALALALACGCRTQPFDEAGITGPCTDAKPTCVAAPEGCDPPRLVDATCDEATLAWTCPAGARVYSRAVDGAACLPFHDEPGLSSVSAWGLSSLVRVPTDDGRCLWLAESATLANGTKARNVALEPDLTAPFGSCPTKSVSPPESVVQLEGGADPSLLVQIDGGYRLGGVTHVPYRLFRVDATAVYGVDLLGSGVGRFDRASGKIVIPSPQTPFPWSTDLGLGDAYLDAGDRQHEYVLGCAQKGGFLLQGCELARLDAMDHAELLAPSGQFVDTVDPTKGVVLFGSGAWLSSLFARTGGGFEHVYIGDFGGTIGSHVSPTLAGPWKDGPMIAKCDTPAADPNAMCAGPVAHPELADPTRPNELAITYGLGTTGAGTGRPDDYWPRLVRSSE